MIGKKTLIAFVFILLISLFLAVFLTINKTNLNSHAAAPDQLEAEGGVLGGNAKAQTDSSASGGNYILFQPNIKSVTVTSIVDLKNALADNSIDEIVVANGTYHISGASSQAADSLWIGSRYASRSRPITVKAQTRGGVTFDGGGTTYFGCISFEDGAHDQTWDGFNCAGGEATDTGIITFGGYAGNPAPHHITMRFINILPTCTGNALNAASPATDHAFYISQAVGGPHDLLFEDITVDGAGFLASAFHFYHSDATNQNGWNVTVRRLHVKKTQQAIILWDPTLKNITFDTADISNPIKFAVRYETTGATNILLQNITSDKDFYSSLGTNPTGVTFVNDAFNSPVNTSSGITYTDYNVPETIDKTGATDTKQTLLNFIATVPNGTDATHQTRIVFPAGGIYRIDSALRFGNRHFVTFEGNGAIIKYTSVTGTNENYSLFYLSDSAPNWDGSDSYITIHNFTLIGSSPQPGVYLAGNSPTGGEGQHGIIIAGGTNFEAYGNTIKGVWGDGLYVGGGADTVWLHNNDVQSVGRNGLTIISGSHVTVDHNNFTKNGYMPFDIEPNNANENTSFVNFNHNTTGSWTNAWFAADGANTSTNVHDIILDNNKSVGKSLFSIVDINASPRRSNFKFTNNSSDTPAIGPVFRISHVDNLTITGNTQPLSSGLLTGITDSTSAIISPNP